MLKIDFARLNALRPQPKPSDNPPEDTSPHSANAAEPMEVDKAPMGRTLRKRKRKVAKHLKRETNEKETESFQKRVFRIPLEKPFEEAYFTHRLWMFFRETRDTEEDIRRICPSDWENDYYNPTMAAHTRDTMHTEKYDEDYEEEQNIKYRAILDEEDRLLHHSSWKRNAPSIDRTVSPSIDNHLHQTSQKRASTDIAYYPSIDSGVDLETAVHEPGADELHEGFTYEEILNMQRRDEADQHRVEASGERTRFSHSFDKANPPSIDEKPKSSIDIRPKPPSTVSKNLNFVNQYLTQDEFGIFRDPDGYARAIDGYALQISREDIADILQMANGADNLFMQQRTVPTHQQKVTNEFYDTGGGINNRFKQRAYDHDGTRRFQWEEKDEYGVYRDDQGHARDVDEHIIRIEAIQKELVEIQRYITCRPEASTSIDRRNNKSTDNHKQTSVDEATNQGRLVPKVISDMSDTHNHGEDISADTYATLMRRQFNFESLEDRLQEIENTTATMKDKWRKGDEAMQNFTDLLVAYSTKDTKVDQPVNYVTLAKSV
ncbi:hypothetical protein DY000_02049127 [Brassica cretica]|uniref:Uncharacterized protein n=1 Tax=Brassica cretica TaxID=69181 RepID=A0ABQ7F2F1_BRACR|nr:hypothetical protein DY000_02049127 [Brassica cretica]